MLFTILSCTTKVLPKIVLVRLNCETFAQQYFSSLRYIEYTLQYWSSRSNGLHCSTMSLMNTAGPVVLVTMRNWWGHQLMVMVESCSTLYETSKPLKLYKDWLWTKNGWVHWNITLNLGSFLLQWNNYNPAPFEPKFPNLFEQVAILGKFVHKWHM